MDKKGNGEGRIQIAMILGGMAFMATIITILALYRNDLQNRAAHEFNEKIAGSIDNPPEYRYQFLSSLGSDDTESEFSEYETKRLVDHAQKQESKAENLMIRIADGNYLSMPKGHDLARYAQLVKDEEYGNKGNCYWRATLRTLIEWHNQRTKTSSFLIPKVQSFLYADDPNLIDCPHTLERYESETDNSRAMPHN